VGQAERDICVPLPEKGSWNNATLSLGLFNFFNCAHNFHAINGKQIRATKTCQLGGEHRVFSGQQEGESGQKGEQ